MEQSRTGCFKGFLARQLTCHPWIACSKPTQVNSNQMVFFGSFLLYYAHSRLSAPTVQVNDCLCVLLGSHYLWKSSSCYSCKLLLRDLCSRAVRTAELLLTRQQFGLLHAFSIKWKAKPLSLLLSSSF